MSSDSYMTGWRAGYHNATLAERKRLLELLMAKGAIRESLVSKNGLVLYTQDGPIDITKEELDA